LLPFRKAMIDMKTRTPPLLLLVFLLLMVILVRPALAHANLLQSTPEANARLEQAPAQIELLFSEPIEPSFSTIEVLDGTGNRVDNQDAKVEAADPTRMTVSLRSLPDGVYTVSWRTLSSVDSHITEGAFPFAVGEVDAATLEAASQASQQFSVSPGEVLARWLTYLASLALTGGALFVVAVWQPATKMAALEGEVRPPWRRISTIAMLLLVAASLAWLLLQAGQAAGQEIALPWDPAVGQVLFTTRFGVLWLARIALALLMFWLLQLEGSPPNRWLAFGVGTLLLLTISMGSHGAAEPEPFLPILSDWIHLIAASVWVGGLIHFVAAMLSSRELDDARRSRLTSILIPRFSSLALISVGAIVLTGVYATILHVGSFEALATTVYGRALLVKLAFFLSMVALGAVNLLSTSPKMKLAAEAGGKPSLVRRFRRLISTETMLGAAVLFSVATLTTLPPARVPEEPSLGGSQEVDDLEISLEVTPGRPGINTFLVTVTSGGEPELAIREVSLQFTPATVEVPPSSITLIAEGEGQYSFLGGSLALPDTWQVQVAVRRMDAFDSFANYELDVGTPTGDSAAGGAFPWQRLAGVFLLVAAVFFWLAVSLLARNSKRTTALGRLPAISLVLVGFVVFLSTPVSEPVETLNPIAPNAASIAAGQALYEQNCTPCHGVSGAGDGPVGLTLNPPPADLTIHTAPGVHPDAQLYDWITNGFRGSVMPAFREQLSDEERWHLVNYIRTLAQP
jgi:copper transport protein